MFLRNTGFVVRLMEALVNSDGSAAPTGTAAATGKPARAKAEVEKVTMEDGREVEFAGKRKMLKESVLPTDGTIPSVRFDFRNGKSRLYTLNPLLLAQFAAHGAAQKIGDETAGEEDVDDMLLAVEEIIGRLTGDTPEWTVKREGGGFGGVSILLRALMEVQSKDEATVKAFLKPLGHAEKMALRSHIRVKPVVERLEAEKAAKAAGASKVNTDELLASL